MPFLSCYFDILNSGSYSHNTLAEMKTRRIIWTSLALKHEKPLGLPRIRANNLLFVKQVP